MKNAHQDSMPPSDTSPVSNQKPIRIFILLVILVGILLGLLWAGRLLLQSTEGEQLIPANASAQYNGKRRVIVLGFDGADPGLCERWMNEINPETGISELPHLAKLKEQGVFRRMRTTFPAQTPVAWATAACSANPGKTGIADFVRRDPKLMNLELTLGKAVDRPFGMRKGYRWMLAFVVGVLSLPLWIGLVKMRRKNASDHLSTRRQRMAWGTISGGLALGVFFGTGWAITQWLPSVVVEAKNLRQGTPLWTVAGDAGVRSVILNFPLTFPAEKAAGLRMLSGLGVPDVTGNPYSWTILGGSFDAVGETETLGVTQPWEVHGDMLSGSVQGPENPLAEPKERPDAKNVSGRAHQDKPRVRVAVTFQKGQLRIGNSAPQLLRLQHWSQPFRFTISFSPLLKLHVVARAILLKAGDKPDVLIGPLQFDPENVPSPVRLSTPPEYVKRLAERIGNFPTAGWAIATHPAKDGFLADEPFLRDLNYAFDRHEAMFEDELGRDDWDLLVAVFMETDRAAHILWKHLSTSHPLHDPQTAPAGVEALKKVYRRMDALVGKAMARAKKLDADLIVLSDHGFAAFDWQVHLNSVLRDAGLLVLKQESLPIRATQVKSSANFHRIDFTKTQAYALGLGGIYLNMKGREANGTVSEEERDLVVQMVEGVLLKLRDPVGKRVVRRVVRNEDVYSGSNANLLPDLLVCFESGFRVSWATTVGGAAEVLMEPNRSNWSGDHCSIDPELVPGIFFSSRSSGQGKGDPSLTDLAPTILSLLGVSVPKAAGWEGKAFWTAHEQIKN